MQREKYLNNTHLPYVDCLFIEPILDTWALFGSILLFATLCYSDLLRLKFLCICKFFLKKLGLIPEVLEVILNCYQS